MKPKSVLSLEPESRFRKKGSKMIYVFDTSSLKNSFFSIFYLDHFPSLWKNFDKLVETRKKCYL